MTFLSRLLGLLRAAPTAPSAGPKGAGAQPSIQASGALSAPPELTSETEEGFCDLLLYVEQHTVLPMGSQELHATAVHRGRRVALEVVLGPEWREGTFADQPSFQGMVTYRSVGSESDALLRILDELYGTKAAPRAMARLTDFTCLTLGGDPRELGKGPVRAKLFFESEHEELNAELYTNVDLAKRRLEIREKDPGYRAAILRSLTDATPASPSSSHRQ
jgi:hypothetical protein